MMSDGAFRKGLEMLKLARLSPTGGILKVLYLLKRALFSGRHECVLVACMPKSGSTFLTNCLSGLLGLQRTRSTYGGYRNDQNLYPPYLINILGRKSVCQIHMKATEANLELMEMHSIRTIVLVRNIFDTVVSILDHLYSEDIRVPTFWVGQEFFELTENQQIDAIVELAIPWYVGFFVSWYEADLEGTVHPIWLTYEELTTDPAATLRLVTEAFSIDKSNEEIDEALKKVGRRNVRFNKGVSGRGQQRLSESQIMKITGFTRFYPSVDFSRIGIPRGRETGHRMGRQ